LGKPGKLAKKLVLYFEFYILRIIKKTPQLRKVQKLPFVKN